MTIKKWVYRPKTEKELSKKYNSKKKVSDFKDFEDLKDWYDQEKVCYYCGVSEEVLQEIIHKGILTSSRFPLLGGIHQQGKNRGYWLEIDRKLPKENYSRNNCVLSCYLCNNDKSDVFDEKEYPEFLKDRSGYLNKLVGK
jgi:hypothetical protein